MAAQVDAPAFGGGRLAPGWQVAAVCFVMAVCAWGIVFYGHSVFLDALQARHGWSVSLISTAILVSWFGAGLGTVLVGFLADRHGAVPVVAAGALMVGGAVIAIGQATAPWQMFVAYALMGIGYPGLSAAAIGATLAPWFDRRFGFVLALALSGASVGGAVLPPLMVSLSAQLGFPAMTTLLGLGCIVVMLPGVVLLARRRPPARAAGASASGVAPFRIADTLRQARFWCIAIAAGFSLAGQVGFLGHQIPMLRDSLGQAGAAYAVTVVALSAALGRIAVGTLSRHIGGALLTAGCYLVQAAGFAIVLAASEPWALYVGAAVAGFVVGAIVMMPPILVRASFGTASYGRVYALVGIVYYLGAGLGPWLAGLARDLTGSYDAALWLLIALHVIAAATIAGLRPRPV